MQVHRLCVCLLSLGDTQWKQGSTNVVPRERHEKSRRCCLLRDSSLAEQRRTHRHPTAATICFACKCRQTVGWFHISFHTLYLQVAKGWTCPSTHVDMDICRGRKGTNPPAHTGHAALPLAPAASQVSSVVSSQAKEVGHAIHPGAGTPSSPHPAPLLGSAVSPAPSRGCRAPLRSQTCPPSASGLRHYT